MLASARIHKRAVVIGGGLLGLEAAWGLKQRGMSVALVHLMPTLMERQLDAAAGQLLQRDLDRRGIAFFTDGQTEEITGQDRAEGVQLGRWPFHPGRSGGLGHRHSPQYRSGQGCRSGSQSRHCGHRRHAHQRSWISSRSANASNIAAAVFGLVAPIWDQAKVCAARPGGDENALFTSRALSTSLKITGVDVFSAGALMDGRRR
jgi:nitrite reductase (NADH) large subunit